MKCNCIKTIEDKALKTLQETNKGKGIVSEVSMQNMGMSFEELNEGWHTSQPIEYQFTPIKKDGTTGRTIKKEIDMYHTFCPFCGVKISTEKTS